MDWPIDGPKTELEQPDFAGMLFDLTYPSLGLTLSHGSHFSQSVSINFELRRRAALRVVAFVGQSCYLISPIACQTSATFRVVGFPSQEFYSISPITHQLAQFSIAFRTPLRLSIHLNSTLISRFPSFSRVLSIANYTAVESSPYITPSERPIYPTTQDSTKMASGINRAPPRLIPNEHTKRKKIHPHQQPRTKKRKRSAKFPKQETIAVDLPGPLLVLHLHHHMIVPPIHIRLNPTSYLSMHVEKWHRLIAGVSTVLPSLMRPFMGLQAAE
ncbi:hypothetical protein BS47DRAFT_1391960 [Hydnum rufescens UP504]|uniref:Uncharacterized protein n=1 Tax=Hydnum rufescens UP504 TaxID=1448309 RepID=A0A9P6B060_9AGAM|nr:hypothetical protein BS47DRAFT_1391960 [Hydnum rufescens UP504]